MKYRFNQRFSKKETYPLIAIMEEKHTTCRYIVNSEKDLLMLCLHTVLGRFKDGWYCDLEEEPPKPPTPPPAEAAPMYHDLYRAKLEDHKRCYTVNPDMKAMFDKAVAGDAEEALGFLMWRSQKEYEYEKFELETPDEIPTSTPV